MTAFAPAAGAVRWELLRSILPHGVARADTVGDRLPLQDRHTGLATADPATGRILGSAAGASPVTAAADPTVVTGPVRTTVLTRDG